MLKDFRAAVSFLTLVPAGDSGPDAVPAPWFGLVGWLLGAVAALFAWATSGVAGDGRILLVAVLIVGGWAVLTRLLHWDGLADTADAVWGAHDAESRLAIMHDSRSGAFAIAAVVFVALAQVFAVAQLISWQAYGLILITPVLGRLSATVALATISPARTEGLAASLAGRLTPRGRIITVVCAVPLAVFAFNFPVTCVLGLLAAWGVPKLLARSVNGLTGDILGASILLVETITLIAAAMAGGW